MGKKLSHKGKCHYTYKSICKRNIKFYKLQMTTKFLPKAVWQQRWGSRYFNFSFFLLVKKKKLQVTNINWIFTWSNSTARAKTEWRLSLLVPRSWRRTSTWRWKSGICDANDSIWKKTEMTFDYINRMKTLTGNNI